jgi:hypothetical protein
MNLPVLVFLKIRSCDFYAQCNGQFEYKKPRLVGAFLIINQGELGTINTYIVPF